MAFTSKRVVFAFLIILLFSLPINEAIGPGSPVVLVPGDGGSQFMARLDKPKTVHEYCKQKTTDYFSLWLNLEELLPYVLECFVDNMRLVYDNVTHTTSNSPGVDLNIPGFGNTSSVEWLDPSEIGPTSYFSHIVDALVSWGYKRNLSVRGAPYDFRKAPNEMKDYLRKVPLLIEDTYRINNNKRVVLIAHSMGNPYMLYLMNNKPQAWKDKYIKSMITLAGVWGGAVKPLRLITSGDNLGLAFVNPRSVRLEQRSMPSTSWLMPSDQFWQANEVLIVSPTRNYTVNDYRDLFYDLGFPDGYSMRLDTVNLIRNLTPPGIEIHCLHGNETQTPDQLIFSAKQWPDMQPNVVFGDGDGTVNIRSLHGCLHWIGKQKQKILHKVFPHTDHMNILKQQGVFDYIKYVVYNT